MSNPVPAHLEVGLADLERGNLDGSFNRADRLRLYSDLIVANAVPAKYQPEVAKAIDDGWLSPAGDVLREDDFGDDFEYNVI